MSENPGFQIALRGEAIKDGAIAAPIFADLLKAVNVLLQTVNSELNGNDLKIQVNLEATEKGSFIADFSVRATEVLLPLSALAIMHGEEIKAVNALLDTILKFEQTIAGPVCGIIALLKWLKGRQPDKTEQKNGDTYIHIGDNYVMTDTQTWAAAQKTATCKAAKKIVAIAGKKGIETLNIKRADSSPIQLAKEDINSFDTEQGKEAIINSSERETVLEIISPHFDGVPKWQVSEGDKPFSAAIEDEYFLERVERKEIAFKNHDSIKCSIKEEQFQTARGLRKETTILEVIKFLPSPPPAAIAQYELFS